MAFNWESLLQFADLFTSGCDTSTFTFSQLGDSKIFVRPNSGLTPRIEIDFNITNSDKGLGVKDKLHNIQERRSGRS
mgnify:CR=1 FL=1